MSTRSTGFLGKGDHWRSLTSLVKEWLLNFKGCVVVRIAMVDFFGVLSQCQKHGKAKKNRGQNDSK